MASSPRMTLSIMPRSCELWFPGRRTTTYPSSARSATSTRATPMWRPSMAATSATDMVFRQRETISWRSKVSLGCDAAPRRDVMTWASISRLWSTGWARPEVIRYGRSSEMSGSSVIATLLTADGVLQLLDEPGGQDFGGAVGEHRHLVGDRAEAGLLVGEDAE